MLQLTILKCYLKEQKFINEIPDIDTLFVLGSGDWSDT